MEHFTTSHVIAAVIGAVVSAILKPLFEWAVSSIKDAAAVKTLGRKLRAAFAKENRTVIWSTLHVLFWCAFLVVFAFDERPPTRRDILMIAGVIVMLALASLDLLWEIGSVMYRRHKSAEAERNPLKGA